MSKKRLVVLTGAGISAESGLQTFRDGNGLWNNYKFEEVATPEAWNKDPELVLAFYNQRRNDVLNARPNLAHTTLFELEDQYDVQIITQNIDDLHERAGSKKVLHLHGEILQMKSERDDTIVSFIDKDMEYGQRAPDGGQWRPNIVWFGEPVPLLDRAIDFVRNADVFLLIGSSLAVYPAAGLINYVKSDIPKYVIDRKIPINEYHPNLILIERPATEGILIFKDLLNGNVDRKH